jgi:Ca-activated chloride channel family protein
MISFAWPWIGLLLPLPWLFRRWVPPMSATPSALFVPWAQELGNLGARPLDTPARQGRFWLMLFLWLALISASMRPQWMGEAVPLPNVGRDLMLAVDISGSMETEDFVLNRRTVDRLTAAQRVASEFIDRRKGDHIGLILFGTHAYLQSPLSFDLPTIKQLLNDTIIGAAGTDTAIGEAIGLGIRHLRERPENDRVLILMTDGANTAGSVSPLEAAEMAAKYGIRIYTIGIGADELIIRSFFGDRKLNPSSDLDEETLQAIADKTSGRYFRARDVEEMQQIYQILDELEPVEQEAQHFRPITELYIWPLGTALILSSLIILSGRREWI